MRVATWQVRGTSAKLENTDLEILSISNVQWSGSEKNLTKNEMMYSANNHPVYRYRVAILVDGSASRSIVSFFAIIGLSNVI